uniref:DUF2179 domain-containing protein n=1 Tax=Haemonchus contortus TaxID=6289 RepID=A0A7I4XVV0_HAECO
MRPRTRLPLRIAVTDEYVHMYVCGLHNESKWLADVRHQTSDDNVIVHISENSLCRGIAGKTSHPITIVTPNVDLLDIVEMKGPVFS